MLKQFLVIFITFHLCVAKTTLENKITFECPPSENGQPSKEIIVKGETYKCPYDQVCDDVTPNPTFPCVEEATICNTAGFECTPTGAVLLQGLPFELDCNTGFVCNKNRIYPCKPCIEKQVTCEKKWSCPGPTDSEVNYMGLSLICDQFSKCNEETKPCAPCVSRVTGRATNFN